MVKASYRALLWGTSALVLSLVLSVPALAQDASDSETITVTGIRQSMRDSLILKRNTPLVSDNISTEDIGQLPDVTIAEELNRLPGINTTRDRGNASQASVRGMGPRLVFGLLNGRDVASSEPSQAIRWEIFPSEVLGGVQVYKSQDAALIPGGIAATIDIRTIQPLDYHGQAFSLRAGPTYHEGGSDLPHYEDWGYRGSAGFIKHLSDTFAVAVAASVQRSQNGFPDFRTFGWNTPDNSGGATGDLNGDGRPDNTTWGLVTEVKEVQQDRASLLGAIGWRPTPQLTVNADLLYSEYEISENQFQLWYANNTLGNWQNSNAYIYNAPGNSYNIVNGSVVAANLNGNNAAGSPWHNYQSSINRYEEFHNLWAGGLNLAWTNDDWDATLDLSHSEAWRENRWQAIYLAEQYFPQLQFDVRDGAEPSAVIGGANPSSPAAQSTSTGRNGQSDGPWTTQDELNAAALDLDRHFEGSFLTSFELGARFSDRTKSVRRNQFQYCSGVGAILNSGNCGATPGAHNVSLANAGLESFNVDSYFTAPPMVWGDFDRLLPLVYPNTNIPAGSELLLSHSDVEERMSEGYAKINFGSEDGRIPWEGSLGLRFTSVEITSSGYQSTSGAAPVPVTLTNEYTETLPSLNLVFHLSDDQLLRFGAARAIARPPLDALVTAFNLDPIGTPPTGGGGNPFLRPYRADQLDLSYEWYFHDESLFAIAVFYKDLSNFIGASQTTQTINGVQYIITAEGNGDGGFIRGAEVTFQTRLFFLPGFLEDFGVYANYAVGDSNIHEFAPASNPYTMIGLTDSTGEFDIFYNRGGFEARVAYKHHGEFTVAPTWVGTTLKEQSPEDTLDASVSYDLGDHWSFRLNGRNLTDEPSRRTSDNNTQNLSNDGGYQLFGRTFLFDVAFRY